MSTAKVKYQNLNENKTKISQESSLFNQDMVTDNRSVKNISQLDKNVFLLNNLLMSVQFFENYERDIHYLRENWFREVSLESHHKKCFYADSLFRLAKANVKFSPRHGEQKNLESSLHPLRIYVSSDNVEAAYDPSALGHIKRNVWPQYQFTVKTKEKNEKSGCIHLVEYKAMETQTKSSAAKTSSVNFLISRESDTENKQHPNCKKKSERENLANKTRRLTKVEKFVVSQNQELNPRVSEKRNSFKFFTDVADTIIPPRAFYRFTEPKSRVKPIAIYDFRMNSGATTSHEIPLMCFQRQDVKLTLQGRRRSGIKKNQRNPLFSSQNVLNAAAFKGYFCDLLVETLSEALVLNFSATNAGSVLEEFIIVNQTETQYCIAPIITIRDWNNFIVINRRLKDPPKTKKIIWPSGYMQKIMNILPCHAVPIGHTNVSEENPDYEKEWKLVFPKAEEFLVLHLMHAQVRCYFFALLIYKTFIETEINVASFGPKHLLHLLFWRVHKNFLAWPEDRPGETLLIYLKALYKRLQNKRLCDYFIPTRNLFATSLPKDLHKAQSLIKNIIENPVFSVIRAIRNLKLNPDFYPSFDSLKLYTILSTINAPEKLKPIRKKKRQKTVHFEDEKDDEQRWKKEAIKQIELDRKTEEEESASKLSVQSVNINEKINLNPEDQEKWGHILEIFLSHFLKMRNKSLQFNFSSQALFYLSQAQKIFDLIVDNGGNQTNIIALHDKFNKLKESSFSLKLSLERTKVEQLKAPAQTENTLQNDTNGDTIEENKENKTETILKENIRNNISTTAEEYRESKINIIIKDNQKETATERFDKNKITIFLKEKNRTNEDDENKLYETKL